MNESVALLLIEDNPGDARLIREFLKEIRNPVIQFNTTHCLQGGIEYMHQNKTDIVLLDMFLPDSSGLDTFIKTRECKPNLPIIVLTGLDDEEMAMESVKRGAQDYLLKGKINPETLKRAIRYALERSRILQLLIEKEKKIVQSEKITALVTLLSGMAHNFNNPLCIAGGVIYQLKSDKNITDSHKKMIEQVETQLARISKIVHTLDDLTSQMAARDDIISLDDMVLSAISDAGRFAVGKKVVDIQVDLQCKQTIRGNAMEVRQALANLLTNAVEAIVQDGVVRIRTYALEKGCVLEITDNGKGISNEILKNIYDPFFTTKEGAAAIGLGLSVAQRIVERHGGTIEIQSEKNQGTRVTVFFPKPAGIRNI